jgi:hypothetical protein
MSHLQRLLRGVETNEAKIRELTMQLDAMEKTLQNLASQEFGSSSPGGGVKQSSGEVRIGSAKKASKMDKDGFSIFAFAVDQGQESVGTYDILTDLQKIPTDLGISQFTLYGVQGSQDDADQFPMNATIARAIGMRPAYRPNTNDVVPDAELALRAAYGPRSQESAIQLFTLSESAYDAVPFIEGVANSNLMVLLKDMVLFNKQKERVGLAIYGNDDRALLRTDPDGLHVRYKDVGTLPAIIDINNDKVLVSNTTAWTTILEFDIPANTLGTGGVIHCKITGFQRNTEGTTRTIQPRVQFGGVNYPTAFTKSFASGGNEENSDLEIIIAGDGATNAQKLWLQYKRTATIFDYDETPAVDSTVDQRVTVQIKFSFASALLYYEKRFSKVMWYDTVDSSEKLIRPWDDLNVDDFATVEIE